jgi:predicted CoA-binding protein
MPLDSETRALLQASHVIAMVGCSDKSYRDSFDIARFLRSVGYRVYPVNPTIASADGFKTYPDLASVPEPIDIVNVFRRSEFLPAIVQAAIPLNVRLVWGQVGVSHLEAERLAKEAHLALIMNRCIMVEYERLMMGW